MKTSSCFFSPTSLGVCVAAAAFFATDLNGQIARTNALAFATGDTNALRESVAALQARVALSAAAGRAAVQGTNLIGNIESSGVADAGQLLALSQTAQAQVARASSGNGRGRDFGGISEYPVPRERDSQRRG